MARWQSCNILHLGADAHRLWQFDAKGNRFAFKREHRVAPGQPLPFNMVAKSWRSLFQPKLNVAWLPPENVFFRVIHLPKSNFEELLSMVELQLEKLSPLPVAQIVWMIHVLSQSEGKANEGEGIAGDLQTVVVVIAARQPVEEFLGKLEGHGYLADRLEAPMLDELEATPATEDGAWIYPAAHGEKEVALVVWRFGGVLRNLSLVVLPPTGDRAKSLKDQLAQLTWAGELEGWLAASPDWHLITEGPAAEEWEKMLRTSIGDPIKLVQPVPAAELAGQTARRAARAHPRATLLPQEFSTRYQQQFVDRLWLRGLMGVGLLYILYVVIYMGATRVLQYQTNKVEQHVRALSGSYTNVLQLEARYKVLQQRQNLKYAALDCWKIVAEQLPAGISLQRFSFADGQRLSLNGTVEPGQIAQITGHFYDGVRKAKLRGAPIFNPATADNLTYHQTAGRVNWRFSLTLKNAMKEDSK